MGKKAVSYLLYHFAIVLTLALLAAAVVSWYASFISPEQGGFWTSMALLMPVVLLANLAALVWWLVRRKWWLTIIPVGALVFNMGFISAMVQLPDFRGSSEKSDLRIATLNANGFRWLGDKRTSAKAVAAMAFREQADVLCLQEFVDWGGWPADSVATFFKGMPYFVREGSIAVLSRFPILDHRAVLFPETNNSYLYADLLVGKDTVRVISVHLQTSGIASLRRHYMKEYGQEMPMEVMFELLERNSEERAVQVRDIRALVDASPMPVVLVGDFNDTPSSYTYRTMLGDLTDGFRAAGNGYGGTFRYMGGVLRIDYIFYNDAFSALRYYMPKDKISDHKTVIADLQFAR